MLAIGFFSPLRPHQQQRTVGGTAADINDQHAFFFAQRRFEIQTGGDRLKLKHDVAKARALCRTFENALRLGVGIIAAQSLEVNRAADNRLIDGFRQLRLRLEFDMQHHGAH